MLERDTLFDDANGHLAVGELEEAIALYRRCVALDPAFFDGWHALGMALLKTGEVKEAIGSTGGFSLVLAGAKAWLEQGLTLGLIGDRHPKGVPGH